MDSNPGQLERLLKEGSSFTFASMLLEFCHAERRKWPGSSPSFNAEPTNSGRLDVV
jgi:hypothetical protein